MKLSPMIAVAVGALVVGLAAPAAASEASHLISGSQIKNHSITGKKLASNTLTGKQIKESSLGTVPKAAALPPLKWHEVTHFDNGWRNLGGGFRNVAYAVDAQGIVHLRGIVSGGTSGTEAFALPSSLTNVGTFIITPVETGTEIGFLQIGNGKLIPKDQSGSAVTEGTDLDGVTWSSVAGSSSASTHALPSSSRGGIFASRH